MPEAVKEGSGVGEVAVPDDAVTPAVDLATDGVVEVKPPPATEPSLPADQIQQENADSKMEEIGETAPEVKEPPTEESIVEKIDSSLPTSSDGTSNETKPNEEEVNEMVRQGKVLLEYRKDSFAAAEILSKACEKASAIHGELSDHCAELYYLYGCSMLECAKSENNVLGEGVKDKEEKESSDDDDEEEEEVENNEEGKGEEMEVDGVDNESAAVAGTSNGDVKMDSNEDGEDVTKEDEDEDSSLKVAWEMFELAKVVFTRQDNKEKLADTLMKLGEVGIESGHPEAMVDMISALEIRESLFPNKRIIPETHFNIGLAYSMFELFDEAITHFQSSKKILEEMISKLENVGDEESAKEAKEIKDILPDLNDKIQDMVESKQEKRKEMEKIITNGLSSFPKENGTSSAGTSKPGDSKSGDSKPASNISHLIKRKRKIDEVTSDLPTKSQEEPKRKVKAVEEEVPNLVDVSSSKECIDKVETSSVEQMETEEEKKSNNSEKVESTSTSDCDKSKEPEIEKNNVNKLELGENQNNLENDTKLDAGKSESISSNSMEVDTKLISSSDENKEALKDSTHQVIENTDKNNSEATKSEVPDSTKKETNEIAAHSEVEVPTKEENIENKDKQQSSAVKEEEVKECSSMDVERTDVSSLSTKEIKPPVTNENISLASSEQRDKADKVESKTGEVSSVEAESTEMETATSTVSESIKEEKDTDKKEAAEVDVSTVPTEKMDENTTEQIKESVESETGEIKSTTVTDEIKTGVEQNESVPEKSDKIETKEETPTAVEFTTESETSKPNELKETNEASVSLKDSEKETAEPEVTKNGTTSTTEVTSQISSESKTVTNGCKEDQTQDLKSNVAAKEVEKEEKDLTPVATD